MNVALLIYTVVFFAFLYYTCSRYEYWTNVLIYTIGMGLIPEIFSFSGIGAFLISILLRFVIGLILLKLLIKINDFLQNGVYFFIIGLILEIFISRFVIAFIVAFVATI